MYRATNPGDDEIIAGEWELIDAATATGWAHGSDITKIDGGKIYTDSITADKISVNQLDALAVNTGSLTVDEYIQSSDYVEGVSGFKLTNNDGLKIWTGEVNVQALTGIITQIKEATISNQSIASTTFADLLTLNLTTEASNLLIIFSAGDTYGSTDGCLVEFRIQVDGVTKTGAIYGIDDIEATGVGGGANPETDNAGDHQHNINAGCEYSPDCDSDGDHSHGFSLDDHTHEIETFNWRVPPALQKFVAVSATSHTVKVQWRRTGYGTAYIGSTYGAQLTVVEFRKSGT
jgi:hypothetical protein